mgnify:CR=1 FL=1
MAKYGIASIAPLNRWCRDYRTGGEEALRPKLKGRPKGVKSKPKPKPTREHELAEENAYLRAKVAYLKKSPVPAGEQVMRRERSAVVRLLSGPRTPARPPC